MDPVSNSPGSGKNPLTHQEIEFLMDEASGDIALADFEAAIPKLERCVELDAQHFDAWHALGLARFKNGDLKKAIGAALMATMLKPNDLLAWTALSQMYVRDGQIGPAEDAKSKARILSLGGKVSREDSSDSSLPGASS